MKRVLVILWLVGYSLLASSQASGDFEAEVTSDSSSEIVLAHGAVVSEFAIASRSKPGAPTSLVAYEGSASQVTVRRFEEAWPIVRHPSGKDWRAGAMPPNETVSEHFQVTFAYQAADLHPASVLWAESATLANATGGMRLANVVFDPPLVHQDDALGHGATYNPEERDRWSLRGNHLALRFPSGVSGEAAGRIEFYFSLGTARLSTSQGPISLVSDAWDDPALPGHQVRLHHVVWYRLEMHDANAHFAVSPQAVNFNSVAYARDLRLENASSISWESFTRLEGSLPEASHQTGPSLWIQGPLNATFEPEPKRSNGERSSYVATISGRPTAYSTGGGAPILLQSTAVVVASAIPVILLVALALYKLAAFLLYSKVSKEKLLEHPLRNAIYQTIQANPGITTGDLSRLLGSYPKKLMFHLVKLQAAKLIACKPSGRFLRYFITANGNAPSSSSRIALLQYPTVARLALCAINKPGISQAELVEQARKDKLASRTVVGYHLGRLEQEALILRRRSWRQRYVEPTPLLLELRSFAEVAASVDLPGPVPAGSAVDKGYFASS